MIYIRRITYFIIISFWYIPVLLILWFRSKIFNRFNFFGKVLTNYLETLGSGFIKVGQISASRPDTFNTEIRAQLGRLHSSVRTKKRDNPYKLVRSFLGEKKTDTLIESIDNKPIGCGSVAQVYKGKLRNGTLVAFKVSNKKLVNNMVADFKIILFFARFLDRLQIYKSIPFVDSLLEIKELIENQADLKLEAENLKTIKENLKHFKAIRIPEIIDTLSNKEVLTMEYIDGFKEAKDINEEDTLNYKKALKEGLTAVYQMIFDNGVVHADLHSGNVGFSNESMVLLDFGIVAKLNDATKKDFGDFFYGFVIGDVTMCSDIIIRQSKQVPKKFNKEKFYESVGLLFDQYNGLNISEFQISGFVTDLFSVQNKFQMIGSKDFVRAIFSLLTFEGILKSLMPSIDFQLEAKLFLLKYRAKSFPRRPWPENIYNTIHISSVNKTALV
ncbi:ABC1 kinase family protein [Changchengzhania lutea]|uniref:ABC1 kinase family protein n=1 Tax=Changchengzhania lutea TaxID=2049305 RepID=UPI00115CA4C3|nr:AarF/UbiB family protein [Changchengzhania lutea]